MLGRSFSVPVLALGLAAAVTARPAAAQPIADAGRPTFAPPPAAEAGRPVVPPPVFDVGRPVVAPPVVDVSRSAAAPPADANRPPVGVRQSFPRALTQGQPFTAEVQVINQAAKPLEDVELSGTWAGGFTLAEADPPALPSAGRSLWSLGRLQVGETRTVRLRFAPTTAAGVVEEFRSELEAGFRSGTTDTRVIPVQKQDLELTVNSPPTAMVGQPITVQVSLKNPCGGAVRGLTLGSRLPDGLSHPNGPELKAPIDQIAGGQTETISLVVTPTKSGVSRAVFWAGGPGVPQVEKSIELVAVDGRIEIDLHGPRRLPQSWPGTFEITVTNAGTGILPVAQVEVAVPPGFEDLRASDGAKFSPGTRKLTWPLLDLRAGERRTLSWLGVANQTGDHAVTVSATASGVTLKQATWKTQVKASEER